METIFAFGLGILLVCIVILIDMVVQSKKNIEKLESKIELISNNLSEVTRVMNNSNNSLYKQVDSVDKKHTEQITRIYSEINQKVDFIRKSLGKDYF